MIPKRLLAFASSRAGVRTLAVALAVYWTALFVGTHIPIETSDEVAQYDKLVHFGAYFGLGGLLTAWLICSKHNARFLPIVVGIAIFAAIDELLQIPVGRHADIRDWIADFIGMLAGVSTAWIIFGRTKLTAAHKESRQSVGNQPIDDSLNL